MKKLTDFPDAHLRLFDRPAPPTPDALRDVYLIGICGTGMGSLAGLFSEAGYAVRGADENVYPPMSTRLAAYGIPVHQGFDAAHLDPPPDLVVVGNACTPTHPEAAYAREQRLAQLSLPEAISQYFIRDRRSLVVAGTHGKTTTTGMLTHVMRAAGYDPGFLVGGVMTGLDLSYSVGSGSHFIVEGDEYDSAYFDKRPKFLHYRPTSAIVTSMEFDHADIYANWDDYRNAFREFAASVPRDGLLALYGDDYEVRALINFTEAKVRYYGLEGGDDHVTATNIRTGGGGQRFTLVVNEREMTDIFLPMSGRHNLRNALGVITVALHEGLSPETLAEAFASFKGMKRRQEIRGEADGVLILDDFAHHPTAVKETIRAVRERWPERRLVAIFEPRSNSSRRKVFEDEYSAALTDADLTFLSAPPLRHNDVADELMHAETVVAAVNDAGTPAHLAPHADALLPLLLNELLPGDVALIMSNGGFGNIHQRLLDALERREAQV